MKPAFQKSFMPPTILSIRGIGPSLARESAKAERMPKGEAPTAYEASTLETVAKWLGITFDELMAVGRETSLNEIAKRDRQTIFRALGDYECGPGGIRPLEITRLARVFGRTHGTMSAIVNGRSRKRKAKKRENP